MPSTAGSVIAMKTLVLMRHAAARDGLDDFRRPLTLFGREDAAAAATVLGSHRFDSVYCSPAIRTSQTLECVVAAGAPLPPANYLPGLYDASADELLAVVSGLPEHERTVLVVAHEPGLSELLRLLCVDGSRTPSAMARCSIAVVTGDRIWSEVEGSMALVRYVVRPGG